MSFIPAKYASTCVAIGTSSRRTPKVRAPDRGQIASLERERQPEEHDEREEDPPFRERVRRDAEVERAFRDDATDRVERGGGDRE